MKEGPGEERSGEVESTQGLDGYPIRIPRGSISDTEATEFRLDSMGTYMHIYYTYICIFGSVLDLQYQSARRCSEPFAYHSSEDNKDAQ